MSVLSVESMTPEQRRLRKLRDLQDYIFLNGQIPTWVAISMYVALAAISMGVAPQLFPGVKAYYVLIGEQKSTFLIFFCASLKSFLETPIWQKPTPYVLKDSDVVILKQPYPTKTHKKVI